MITRKFMTRFPVLVLLAAMLLGGCARQGLLKLTDLEAERLLPCLNPEGADVSHAAAWVVYSDNQAGWRVQEKFLRKRVWTSPWMWAVPFYQLYALGQGVWGGFNYARQMPDYGVSARDSVREAVFSAAAGVEGFVINIGDMVADDGRKPRHWHLFLNELGESFDSHGARPFWAVPGNHEHANDNRFGGPNYDAVFGSQRCYVIATRHCDIFMLDSNILIDQYDDLSDSLQQRLFHQCFVGADSGPRAWLETALEASDKPFKVVMMHHPLLSFGHHYHDWVRADFGPDLEAKRQALLALFRRSGVQLVMSGHDHLYQHQLLTGSDGSVLHSLTGGGGGTPMRDAVPEDAVTQMIRAYGRQNLSVRLLMQSGRHHYYVMESSDEALTVTVRHSDGSLLEKVILETE